MSARTWLAALVLAGSGLHRCRQPRRCRPQPPRWRSGSHDDARRSVGARGHGLQLRHRARPRRPQPATRARHRHVCASWTLPPRSIRPRSTSARSASRRASSVLEQNYEYDLLEPDKLLRKYVGRDVTLVRMRQDGGLDARGRSDGAPAELQQRAGVEDRQRDCHRHARRPHPLSGAARQSVSRGRR